MGTPIYTYSGSSTNTNQYAARNQAFIDFFNDICASPPTGFSYVSSSIPSLSTGSNSAMNAVFSYRDVLIKISITTAVNLYVEIQTSAGATILTSNTQLPVATSTGTYTFYVNFTLTQYSSTSNYDVIRCVSSYSSTAKSFGFINLTDKSPIAEDYIIFSDFASSAFFYTKNNAQLYVFGNIDSVYNSLGQLYLTDAHIYTYATPATYYGKMINCKMGKKGTKTYTAGLFYSVGSTQYLSITATHDLFVAVT